MSEAQEQVITVKEKTCCGQQMNFEEGDSGSWEEPSVPSVYYCTVCGCEQELNDDDLEVEVATYSELAETL